MVDEPVQSDAQGDGLKVVKTIRTAWGSFTLYASLDEMSAYLSSELMDSGITREGVVQLLEEFRISHGVIEPALDEVVAHAARHEPLDKLLVARGTPVVEGRSAKLDFKKRPAGMMAATTADEGKVDYRELAALENVKEGDHIATYIPAIDGHGGIDVFGKVIPAKQIEGLKVDQGENVIYQEKTRKYFASHYGHVLFEHGVLSVSPVYSIPGSLGLAHGNVRFIGRVEIGRDVPDDFQVAAVRGIKIGGTAEACILKSGKEITVLGGVTGKGKGRIECKDDFQARFLNEAEVYAGGDVIVHKEIMNSKVFTRGRLVIPGGVIVGSEVVALRGIICRDAGSELGVKTKFVAGLDYKVHEEIIGINQELVRIRRRQQALLNQAGPLMTKTLKASAVSKSVQNEIKDLFSSIRGMQRTIERLEKQSGEVMEPFEKVAVNCMTVIRDCYSGVNVVVGKYEHEVKAHVSGPISFYPDIVRHQVAIRNDRMIERLWDEMPED